MSCYLVIAGMTFLQPHIACAQMFSVGNEQEIVNVPRTGVYAGFEPAAFMYRGPTGGGPLELGDRFGFSGPLIRLRFESPGVNLFLGTGGRVTGIDNISYFDAGAKATYGLAIVRKKGLTIQVPIQLVTNITSVSNRNVTGLTTQFQQGGLVAGGGGAFVIRPGEPFRFWASLVPSYGFSFATGNTFGGSLYTLEGQARLFIDRLFGNLGLSIGYDYTFKNYNISEDEFDYAFRSHSFLIGITF